MANKKLSDGVGKKIVEALKKQSEIEINPKSDNDEVQEDVFTESFSNESSNAQETFQDGDFLDNLPTDDYLGSLANNENNTFAEEESTISLDEAPANAFNQPFISPQPQPHVVTDNFIKELDTFEIPSNISVLKKLISQLPSGVTRHTGAQIIKQTMEALGISMKSVLQEAQQVQEGLSNSAKECHSTIQEYKKQIMLLEKQAQNHQRQYTALNELISLFIQTGV